MHQARLSIINFDSWNAPIGLHPLCGNHAQELPVESREMKRLQCTAAAQKYQVCQQYDEEVVMTPRTRVPMRADGPRPQAR